MSNPDASSGDERPLAESINAATRKVHARLNRLIMARLPLALPPDAQDPSIYLLGLLHITPIYNAFESALRTLLWRPLAEPGLCSSRDGATRQHARFPLSRLYLPTLMRTDQLCTDIQALTGWTRHQIEEQLILVSQSGPLALFVQHISSTVDERPHVPLDDVPVTNRPPHPQTPKAVSSAPPEEDFSSPLAFFRFSTPADGEDLKREFKERFAEIDRHLTPDQRHDVVQEAVCIFDNMLSIVAQLDSLCGTHGLGDVAKSGKASYEKMKNMSASKIPKSLERSSFDPLIPSGKLLLLAGGGLVLPVAVLLGAYYIMGSEIK